ncbi:NAD(P)H-dependent oxidoreductase [Halomonas sp. HP20-15]|uniref:NADPH-dependent FMN reductase n=1 Tax=Halomonas sp. HP20-15 TaxID=3085901 RepID=UPI002982AA8C|nr:NAD(P)H-dependent oxidoreductase [Halomonas sp. HP20-15]MDW5377204.1 NAD(P)H-dependent oxidoreductase [Halomonas sp. HP20-15]
MNDIVRLAVIYGSVREGRFCDTVGAWVVDQIRRRKMFELEVIDPAVEPVSAFGERLAAADAFIVITPEYNHSYPSVLKALIDSYKSEWLAKPVAFVSYGGAAGGLRAVEHLRHVFAELHAVGIRDGVSFPNVWEQFDDQGQPLSVRRAERGLVTMLARLAWWARSLSEARAVRDFADAVSLD